MQGKSTVDTNFLVLMFITIGLTTSLMMFLIWRINRELPGVLFWMLAALLNTATAVSIVVDHHLVVKPLAVHHEAGWPVGAMTDNQLRREIYATAAIAGILLYLGLKALNVDNAVAFSAGMLVVIALRMIGIRWDLHLPVFRKQ